MLGAVKEGVILAIGEPPDLEAFFPDPDVAYWELEPCPCCQGGGWRFANADCHSAGDLASRDTEVIKKGG